MDWIKRIILEKQYIGILLKVLGYIGLILQGFLSYWYEILNARDHENVVIIAINGILDNYLIFFGGYILLSYVMLFVGEYLINFLNTYNKKEISKLNEKNLELKLKEEQLVGDVTNIVTSLKEQGKAILKDYAEKELECNEGKAMRITLYLKNEDNKLYCIGRHSKNLGFSEYSHDKIYRDSGIIYKIWNDGNNGGEGLFDNDFPDSRNSKTVYVNNHKNRYGLTEVEINGMKMKSRLYYAHRIQNDSGNIGVILVESEGKTKYTKDVLVEKIGELESRLALVLRTTLTHLPSPNSYPNNLI